MQKKLSNSALNKKLFELDINSVLPEKACFSIFFTEKQIGKVRFCSWSSMSRTESFTDNWPKLRLFKPYMWNWTTNHKILLVEWFENAQLFENCRKRKTNWKMSNCNEPLVCDRTASVCQVSEKWRHFRAPLEETKDWHCDKIISTEN